jgi:hypothetical protein
LFNNLPSFPTVLLITVFSDPAHPAQNERHERKLRD